MRRLYRAKPGRTPASLFITHTDLRRDEITGLEENSFVAGHLLVDSHPNETGAGRTKSGSGEKYLSTGMPGGECATCPIRLSQCKTTRYQTGSTRTLSASASAATRVG